MGLERRIGGEMLPFYICVVNSALSARSLSGIRSRGAELAIAFWYYLSFLKVKPNSPKFFPVLIG